MPLIVTPRQLHNRSELYHQLASLIAAGVRLIEAVEMVIRHPAASHLRRALEAALFELKQGSTFHEAILHSHADLPQFDVALIGAGEQSGRLDVTLRLLADYYAKRASIARQIISGLLYPVFIFHFAVLIFPTNTLNALILQGAVGPFLRQKMTALLPIYGILFLALFACQGRRRELWRAGVEKILRLVPVLGAARLNLALARLSAALEGLLSAGVPIIEAWETAAVSCGSPALRRVIFAWKPYLESGETPADMLRRSPQFPEMFANLYSTAEVSGKLDETMRRLYQHYQNESTRQMNALAEWTPRLVYLLVVIAVAFQIVGFWQSYFGNLLNFF